MPILTEPSDRILDEAPSRALKFLGAVSTNAHIHAPIRIVVASPGSADAAAALFGRSVCSLRQSC